MAPFRTLFTLVAASTSMIGLLGGCQSSRPLIAGDAGAFTQIASVSTSAAAAVGADYRLGVPDRVSVRCDRVRGLSVQQMPIDADGFVAVPTLGRVKVSGLTAAEASEALTRRVRTIDPGATMTLEVTRYASRHVYAFGGVGEPGPIAWRPGMHLAEALSATGLQATADLREVSVIRPGLPGSLTDSPRRVMVDFARLLEEGDASVNVVLRAGDVIVVPGENGQPVWASLETAEPKPGQLAEIKGENTTKNETFLASDDQQIARPEADVAWEFDSGPLNTTPVANRAASSDDPSRSPNSVSVGYFGLPASATPTSDRGGVVFWN